MRRCASAFAGDIPKSKFAMAILATWKAIFVESTNWETPCARGGWGFVPFTPAELDQAVAQLKRVLKPEMIYLATVGQRLVGYLLSMSDLNDALRMALGPWDWIRLPQVFWGLRRTRRIRIFGLGVDEAYRPSGLAGLMIKRLFDQHGERFRGWELGWIDSGNIKSIRATQRFIPVEEYKRYYLYQRSIEPVRSARRPDQEGV